MVWKERELRLMLQIILFGFFTLFYCLWYENISHLHAVAEALLEFESISGNEMEKIIKGEKIVKLDKENKGKTSRRRSSQNRTQNN